MSDENQEQQYVEVFGDNGEIVKCEVYDIIDFEDKTYTLLLPLADKEKEDPEVIVFEYIEEGDDCYFKNIEDADEFNRVCEYIQTLDEEDEEE